VTSTENNNNNHDDETGRNAPQDKAKVANTKAALALGAIAANPDELDDFIDVV